jgi:hypothetical protein
MNIRRKWAEIFQGLRARCKSMKTVVKKGFYSHIHYPDQARARTCQETAFGLLGREPVNYVNCFAPVGRQYKIILYSPSRGRFLFIQFTSSHERQNERLAACLERFWSGFRAGFAVLGECY